MPAKADTSSQTARKKITVPPPGTVAANGKDSLDLNHLLYALQAMSVGDFSVRGGIKTVVTAEYKAQ